MKKLFFIFSALLLIGAGCGKGSQPAAAPSAPTAKPSAPSEKPSAAANVPSLKLDELQDYAGNYGVKVTSAFLDKPGFIAAFSNQGGDVGENIGSSVLYSGLMSEGTILLNVYPADGVFVALYHDDGDGNFSALKDQLVTVNTLPLRTLVKLKK
ncbi:MAG: hypothetical protein HW383_421 [Candidatus Magasanikbacteria bacterium]|nr:hypothetical protein [Candidatus Magasanikbacteria bacterium]